MDRLKLPTQDIVPCPCIMPMQRKKANPMPGIDLIFLNNELTIVSLFIETKFYQLIEGSMIRPGGGLG